MKRTLFALASVAALAGPAAAQEASQTPGPQPLPFAQPAPEPRDVPYAGTIRLTVDATDTERRIFQVRETVPVAGPGPLTLLFPKWLPGDHSPTGQLDKFAGLKVSAGGRELAWRRDPADVYAFQIDVPAGAGAVDLAFQSLSPTDPSQGRVMVTPAMLNVQWDAVALYPAGYFTRQIPVEASIKLPAGWTQASALEPVGAATDGVIRFKPVSFATLVDSPLFAGRYAKSFDLDPGAAAPVRLNLFADRPELLAGATQATIEPHRQLVRQAYKLYGSHHYDHYDFLLALSDQLGRIGLEHHRSSENGLGAGYFSEWDKSAPMRDLLPHEYTHSWNGKFRRPADLWTPNFNTPMRDSLLWVYEGQTQYWGFVLAARSGLLTGQQTLDALAATAAYYSTIPGRDWRPLEDTTNDPIIAERRPLPWRTWQRSEDYYSEGQLIWLDADTLIRERTGGKRSLDDFAKAFFGVDNGSWTTRTYGFDDVAAALDQVMPYDWASFLKTRIDTLRPQAPLDGLARGGWKLVYTDAPTDYFKQEEGFRKITDLTYSLGAMLGRDGEVRGVLWDSPAFKAGITAGAKIVAVNGTAYDTDRLKEAITAAKTDGKPISLIVRSGDAYGVVAVDYHGGLRYPRLERIQGTPDRLSAILAPRK